MLGYPMYILFVYTLLKVSHYDLSVLSISVRRFPTKLDLEGGLSRFCFIF